MRFMMMRAENFVVLRRKPIEVSTDSQFIGIPFSDLCTFFLRLTIYGHLSI